MTEFETFWARYPRRVGKLAAQKAYRKALKLATEAEILAGVDRYLTHKPAYAEWAHPTTWLNQGRWLDEYGQRSEHDRRSVPRGTPDRRSYTPTAHADYDAWPSECARLHGGTCAHYQAHQLRLAKEAAA